MVRLIIVTMLVVKVRRTLDVSVLQRVMILFLKVRMMVMYEWSKIL